MTKKDINGNTVSQDHSLLLLEVGDLAYSGRGTYKTDDYGRIMVDAKNGCQIIFFERDELLATQLVKGVMTHRE